MNLEELKLSVRDPESMTQEIVDAKNRQDYEQLRAQHYPPISEQMDMYYWDNMNGTSITKDAITAIKAQFSKPIDGDETLLELIEYKQLVRYDSREAYELAMANK